MRRLAVLTYHPIHIVGGAYADNDLVALEQDLATIDRLGLAVVSLDQAISACGERELLHGPDGLAVAITFDDGSVFDFVDHDHPTCGWQRSAGTILREASGRLACLRGARPLATTFVIASPEARAALDRKDYMGGNYWPQHWWRDATREGVLAVESHSWDHNHASLERSLQRDNKRGTFTNIDTFEEAEGEVAQSLDHIERVAGVRPRFFAYPWGEASDYLRGDYLPGRGAGIGLRAAFSSAPQASGIVADDSDRWLVPRMVCGHDWKSGAELQALLEQLA